MKTPAPGPFDRPDTLPPGSAKPEGSFNRRQGNEAFRSVLVAGATGVIRHVRRGRGAASPWLVDLLKRKRPKLAAVALANKIVRIASKLMVSGDIYRAKPVPPALARVA